MNANRAVPIDELADMVWDGAPPPAVGVTVRGYINRLRKLLGPAIVTRIITRSPGYMAEFGDGELDVLRFAVRCRDGRAALQAGAWPAATTALGEAL
jgi:DNA-binding SARP family transcriptional activator